MTSRRPARSQGLPQVRVDQIGRAGGAESDRIDVNVGHLRNNNGLVRCILHGSGDGFPENGRNIVARATATPSGNGAVCHFVGVPHARDYAVVLHHDENNDAIFQRGAFGIPLEGYGFSNNRVPVLSAPSFQECSFRFDDGAVRVSINMLY